MILDFIKFAVLAVFILLLAAMGFISIFNALDYTFDKSQCDVYVNNESVFKGRCHFISVDSVGENGNTKHLVIYKDKLCFKPLKHYYSENIEVR